MKTLTVLTEIFTEDKKFSKRVKLFMETMENIINKKKCDANTCVSRTTL